MATADPYRLPRNAVPERYELTLTPDIASSTFAGEEHIRIRIANPTRQIQLNSVDLEIFEATLVSDIGEQSAGVVTIDTDTERLIVDFENDIAPGGYTLGITFAGVLNDKLRGFYRSRYIDDVGVEHIIATTQFEATEARRAFPCWDEPDLKAVFAITLIVDDHLLALSNSRVREETVLANGKRQVEFADTIVMSTYILVFIVGPLVIAQVKNVDGTELRVVCVPGRESLTSFAVECGRAALRYFTEYFGIPYPSDKLDLVAIPDFAAGAMENFGCATFRETALLIDKDRASQQQTERVAEVVGHEIAHMWFGDLVTMKWWNGLWLNEAFANFMESMFVDHFRPEWDRWTSVGIGKASAMGVDSLHTTRPIEFVVNAPAEAEEMFDVLTYWKGGAVLRMLQQHLGPDVFRAGVQRYLSSHAYGNAETTDLWDALDAVSDEPVRALMDTWIFQAGHPLLDVTQNDNTTSISQRKSQYLERDDDTLWNVPVGLRAKIDGRVHNERLLLTGRATSIELPGTPEWLVVNENSDGFYPVSYSPDLLHNIEANLQDLTALERFGLVNDTWNACLAGRFDIAEMIGMIETMSVDSDPNVWRSLLAPVRAIDHLVDNKQAVVSMVRRITETEYLRLGWQRKTNESDKDANLRAILIGARGRVGGDTEVRNEIVDRFYRYIESGSGLDIDLVAPAQAILAATNDVRHYETLYARIGQPSLSPQEQTVALQSIGLFTVPDLVERTLEMLMSDEVRSQDAPYVIATMLMCRENGERIWEWIEQHWDAALDRFPNNSIDRMVGGIAGRFDLALLDRADAFLETHPVAWASTQIAQIRERMQVNKAFYTRNHATVESLLRV